MEKDEYDQRDVALEQQFLLKVPWGKFSHKDVKSIRFLDEKTALVNLNGTEYRAYLFDLPCIISTNNYRYFRISKNI